MRDRAQRRARSRARRIRGHGASRSPLLAMTKAVPKPVATIEPTTYPGSLRIGACYPDLAAADAPSGVQELAQEAQALGVLDGLAALVAVEVIHLDALRARVVVVGAEHRRRRARGVHHRRAEQDRRRGALGEVDAVEVPEGVEHGVDPVAV